MSFVNHRDLLSWYFQKEIVGKTFSESSPRKLKIVSCKFGAGREGILNLTRCDVFVSCFCSFISGSFHMTTLLFRDVIAHVWPKKVGAAPACGVFLF